MKKLVPILLCILLLAGCATTYDGPTQMQSVLSEMEAYYFDDKNGDASVYSRTEFAYDIYGNRALRIDYVDDEAVSRTISKYDEAGRLIKQTDYDLGGWFPRRVSATSYTYDDQGRMTSSVHDDGTITYTYDDQAHTLTTTLSDGTYTVQYQNEKGWTLRSEVFFPNGDTSSEEFDRREDGQPLTVRYYENGVLDTVTEYTYDDLGRILTMDVTESGETKTVQRYEYSDGGHRLYLEDGSHTYMGYHEDGTVQSRMDVDKNGIVTSQIIYRYTQICVPADGKEEP